MCVLGVCLVVGVCGGRVSELQEKLQERTLMLICFVVCGWVLQWDRGGRSRLGARESALLNRAAGGWMVKLKVKYLNHSKNLTHFEIFI